MGSLCNFRPSLRFDAIHTKKRVSYPVNLPNISTRLTRTRNQPSCLVLAQKTTNNGRNPEKKPGGSDSSLNVESNGILPKKERVAQSKKVKKYKRPSVLGETFAIVFEILKLLVSSCIYTFLKLKNSVKFQLNWQNLKDVVVGLLYFLVQVVFICPIYLSSIIFWFALVNVLKFVAVVWIVLYGYILLTS